MKKNIYTDQKVDIKRYQIPSIYFTRIINSQGKLYINVQIVY